MSREDSAVVTSKGQLVIPARLRRRHGIRKGTKVIFQEEGVHLIMHPITDEFIRKMKGFLKPKGKKSALDILLEERRRDARREATRP